jgi:hypothetical protein
VNASASEACACDARESQYIAVLVADDSVSIAESARWVLAAMFSGQRIRCAR